MPDARHTMIKAMLSLKGMTLSDVARSLDVAPATLCGVSRGHRRSRRIEAALAHELGTEPAILWPERYPMSKKGDAAMT